MDLRRRGKKKKGRKPEREAHVHRKMEARGKQGADRDYDRDCHRC